MRSLQNLGSGIFSLTSKVASSLAIAAAIAFASPAARASDPCIPHWLPGSGAPGVDGQIYTSMMWDPDGAGPAGSLLIIGGNFNYVGSTLCKNIASFDPQTGVWSPLGDGANDSVRSLAVHNGLLVVGGSFTGAGSVSASGLAKWSGTTWSTFAGWSGTFANVQALAVTSQNHLIVGGTFKPINGFPGQGIARWSGTSWSTFGTGFGVTEHFAPNASVSDLLVLANGDIVAGGMFDLAGGASIKCVARWNGSAWSAMGAGLDNVVGDLLLQPNGEIFAAGSFQNSGPTPITYIAKWNGSAWTALSSSLATVPGGAGAASILRLSNGDLIVTGNFEFAGSLPVMGAARWNGSSWSAMGAGFNGSINWFVNSITQLPGGDLIAGGNFTTADGKTASGLARWDGTTWNATASGSDAIVTALATTSGGDLIAGGTFTMMSGVSANSIARWDGAQWHPFSTGLTKADGSASSVLALAVLSNGDVIAGGSFDLAGGTPVLNIARWNGTSWSGIGNGLNKDVYAIAELPNGEIAVGGKFTLSGATTLKYAAKWTGSSWVAMGSEFNVQPFALAVLPNGDLIAGGMFSPVGGPRCLAKWDGSAWVQYANGTQYWVFALAVAPNGDLIVGGQFTRVNGNALLAAGIARVNGTQWSALGAGLTGGSSPRAEAVTVLPNGDIIAAGVFTTAGGNPAANIARWNGSQWSALEGGIDGRGRALIPLPHGGFAAGGNFSLASSQPSKGFARWSDSTAAVLLAQPADQSICALGDPHFVATTISAHPDLAARWQLESSPNSGIFTDLSDGLIPGAGGAAASISPASSNATELDITHATAMLHRRRVRAILATDCTEVVSTLAVLSVCAADFQCDGVVDDMDFSIFANSYDLLNCDDPAMPVQCPADINRDGLVDDADFVFFVQAYDILLCE